MIDVTGRNRETANQLRSIHFLTPEWTPCAVNFLPSSWMKYRRALEEIVLAHPRIFPGAKRREADRDFDKVWSPTYELGRVRDAWGYLWENVERGMEAYVTEHPLDDWSRMDAWQPPSLDVDYLGAPLAWEKLREHYARNRAAGSFAAFGLPHGFMYMRLFYLRGFNNLMMDLAADDPRLHQLIDIVAGYNAAQVARALDAGADFIAGGDDLGMQTALPISPAMWRKFLAPSYVRIFRPAHDRGATVFLHTDGHILEIIDDLISAGIHSLNPQIGANGLKGLQAFKGRVHIKLDLDRQQFPFHSPAWIGDHIREAYEALHDPRGGLAFSAECGPDVPLENVEAICRTFEEVCRPPVR